MSVEALTRRFVTDLDYEVAEFEDDVTKDSATEAAAFAGLLPV